MSIYSASVDDTDSRIVYSTGWDTTTSDPLSNSGGTLHSTSLFGTFAFFRFTGSAVAIRYAIASGAGEKSRVSFSIDDQPAQVISRETSSSSDRWQNAFWDSGRLKTGPHLLLITNLVDGVSLHLDSIDYEPQTFPRVLPVSTTASLTLSQPPASGIITDTTRDGLPTFDMTSTFTTQSVIPTPTFTNPTFSTAIPAVPPSESSNSVSMPEGPTMQILGGVFAGVVFICFFICLGFVLVRRRKRRITFPDELYFLPTAHKNLSKSPYRSFPKEPEFVSSPPPNGFPFRVSKGDEALDSFRKGALRNLTFQSSPVRPLPPLQNFPVYRPVERRPQMLDGFYQPPFPPLARHPVKRFSLAYALRKTTVARPHPFSAAALREPPTVHLGTVPRQFE